MASYSAAVARKRVIGRMSKTAIIGELERRGVEARFQLWNKPNAVEALLELDHPWTSHEAQWDSDTGTVQIIESRGRGATREVIAVGSVGNRSAAGAYIVDQGFAFPDWGEGSASPLGYRPLHPLYTATLRKVS